MKKAVLRRTEDNGTQALGLFMFEYDDKVMTLGSLELPWKDNARSISCIPKGKYKVTTTYSNKYKKDMWEVLDVAGRSGIRIHSGNTYKDIEGCILLGLSRADINNDGQLDIISSRKAISLASYYLGREFELTII